MTSTFLSPEDVYLDESDTLSLLEREREAYRTATARLDPEEVLWGIGSILPFQATALLELVRQQLREPWEDARTAIIHPDLQRDIARQCLQAIQASIDSLAGMHTAAEG